jgi:cobalt-zinc-cadmium efflux system outer membrane protein
LVSAFARGAFTALIAVSLAGSAHAELPPPAPAAAAQDGVPTLSRVLALAREQAPGVAIARAEIGVGRASYVGARLSPLTNPYVELIAGAGSTGTKDVTVQGSLFVPVEVSGQRGRRVAESDALVAWQEANLGISQASAAGEAVRAFGVTVVAAGRVRTFSAIVDGARVEAELYDARRAAGDATEQDAKLSRVELAKNVVILEEARADLGRALTMLNGLTGATFVDAPPEGSLEPPPLRDAPADSAALARGAPLVQAAHQESLFHARSKERQATDAHAPLSFIVSVGRGDLGEARIAGGLGWSFPFFRKNQGEQARAEAERSRAVVERDVRARMIASLVAGLGAERLQVRRALTELRERAEPAAQASVDAALAMQRAGKGELLHVLTARRDLALLRARRLDLLAREWSIVSDLVALTGELP